MARASAELKIVVGLRASDTEFSLAVLRHVHRYQSRLTSIGVSVCVEKVSGSDLQASERRQTLLGQGITELPTLLTGSSAIRGVAKICTYIDDQLAAAAAAAACSAAAAMPAPDLAA